MHLRAGSVFFVVPNLAIALVSLGLATSHWPRRRSLGARLLCMVEAASFLWNLGECLIMLSADLRTVGWAQMVEDLGAYSIGPAILMFALHLSGHKRLIRPKVLVWTFGAPIFAIATFPAGLDWLYRSMTLVPRGPVSNLQIEFGPLVLPLLLYTNITLALAAIYAGGMIWRGSFAMKLRASALVLTILIPWALFGIETQLGQIVSSVGVAALASGVMVVMLHGLDRHFNSIDISPLARELVVESMPDGMIVTTLEGRIADFNPSAGILLGLRREALGNRIETVLNSEVFADAKAFPIEWVTGNGRTLSVTRSLIQRWREFMGAVFIFRDITENKRIERDLRAASTAAQAAAKLQSDFLANMSHEIRTPLNGITGMNQLLLDTKLDAQQKDYVAIVQESAASLRVIVDDILDFSKIEAGLMQIERVPVNLRRVIQEAAALFHTAARTKGLRLEVRLARAADLPSHILGDPTRIRQVLSNLVSNAIKFTQQGSVIVLLEVGKDWYEVTVRDTGIGFDPAMCDRLFERFVQADSSTTRQYGGTGLGLSICRKLIELMGGSIAASSTPGQGSEFRFRLPMVLCEAAAEPETPLSREFSGKILLAEDNITNQKLASTLLSRLGCEVEVVGDGALALERARACTWDLIFMDCFMPGVDGYEAAERIRAFERETGKRRVPIVAITASVLDSDRLRCLQSGMDDVLAKPIEPSELHRTLSERLASR